MNSVKHGMCYSLQLMRRYLMRYLSDLMMAKIFLSAVLHSIASPKYSPGGTMPRMMMLEYEREVLGFYLSEHPASEMKKAAGGEF